MENQKTLCFCTNCGTQLESEHIFCCKCGTKRNYSASESSIWLPNQQCMQQNNSQYMNYQNTNHQIETISYEDAKKYVSKGLTFLSFIFPVLGLVLSFALRKKRPFQAICCKAVMIPSLIIVCILQFISFVLMTSSLGL